MIRIIYDINGEAVRDGAAKKVVQKIIQKEPDKTHGGIYFYSTLNIIREMLQALLCGDISYEKVVFVFEGQEIRFNVDNSFLSRDWPRAFSDLVDSLIG